MADSTPVETKPESAALAAAIAPAATSAGWWFLRSHKRLAVLLGGGALTIAAGTYGYKYFTASPGKVVAQSEPPAVAQAKEEPLKPAKQAEPSDFLNIKLPETPPVPPVRIEQELDGIKAPTLPPTPPPSPGETNSAPLILPPDIKKPNDGHDIFKAPDDLPMTDKRKPDISPAPLATDVKEKKDHGVREPMPVIRIGAKDVPAVPKIKDVPQPPPPPPATKKDDPSKLDLELPPLPPTPGVKKDDVKKDDLPIISPAPKIESPMIPDVPSVPIKDKEIKAPEPGLPPVRVPTTAEPRSSIKSPMIPDLGPAPPITIDLPSAAPPPKADKKDMYDEDWHTQKDGDTYVLISTEYLHDAKYAAAIEAYNKDRRKPGERIIRVPPTWVLEEKYPGLINGTDKPAVPEVKPAGNLKFEPVAPLTSGNRPAPPPAGASIPTSPGASNEYRVRNDAGETIREIARKVYGDDNSWKKLWELNPNLDPTRPIPSGTTLRLGK